MKRIQLIYPGLFAIFPILFLYAQNAQKIDLSEIISPIILVLVISAAATMLLSAIFRSFYKSALVVTIAAILFFSYGHIVSLIPDFRIHIGNSIIGPNGAVFLIWCTLLFIGTRFAVLTRKNLKIAARVLTQLGILLVVVQLIHGGYVFVTHNKDKPEDDTVSQIAASKPEKLPDIYFIIMDAYARSDILREIYDVDNSDFIDFLEKQGFQVADSSYSNYPQTIMSLSAALNLNYVQNLGNFDPGSSDRLRLAKRLWNNQVFKFLKNLGYTIVAFEHTGSSYTESMNADIIIPITGTLSEFQNILLATTPLPLFIGGQASKDEVQRRLVLSKFEKLPYIDEARSPKFVFAHIFSPHKPFVFGARGEKVDSYEVMRLKKLGGNKNRYIAGYAGQVTYITNVLKETLTKILKRSSANPPIIIVQGDHGPRSGIDWFDMDKSNLKENFAILNTIYLPGENRRLLSESISPVNTFRVIFNDYFNCDYELLPDNSYYCGDARPFDFKLIAPEMLVHTRSRYDYLLDKDFEDLTTLERMILYEKKITERSLADCYADGQALMTFGNGQLEVADCQLVILSKEYCLFEAVFIPRKIADAQYEIVLRFFSEERDMVENSNQLHKIWDYVFTPEPTIESMSRNGPTLIGHVVPYQHKFQSFTIEVRDKNPDHEKAYLPVDSEAVFLEIKNKQ